MLDLYKPAVGINLPQLRDWIPLFHNNALKTSRTSPHNKGFWWSKRAGTTQWEWHNSNQEIEVDAEGWPIVQQGQRAETVMYNNIPGGKYPGGLYIITWDGDAQVSVYGEAKEKSRGINRIEAHVTPGVEGFWLAVTGTQQNSTAKNIKVMLQGADDRWSQGARDLLVHEAVLRFMQPQLTNDSPPASKVVAPSYSGPSGMPEWDAVEMAWDAGAYAWLCIRHTISDADAKKEAEKVKKVMDKRGIPYVFIEFSNEIAWNGAGDYPQHNIAKTLGVGNDPLQRAFNYTIQKTVVIGNIWRKILGDRVKVVFGGWHANSWWTEQALLKFQDWGFKVDAVAVAPYFGGDMHTKVKPNWTVDMVLDECERSLDKVDALTEKQIAVCKKFGLPLIAYEAGQHMEIRNNSQLAAIMNEAASSERMGKIQRESVERWFKLGGGLWCGYYLLDRYVVPKWDGKLEWHPAWSRWGFTDHQDRPGAPRLRHHKELCKKYNATWFGKSSGNQGGDKKDPPNPDEKKIPEGMTLVPSDLIPALTDYLDKSIADLTTIRKFINDVSQST